MLASLRLIFPKPSMPIPSFTDGLTVISRCSFLRSTFPIPEAAILGRSMSISLIFPMPWIKLSLKVAQLSVLSLIFSSNGFKNPRAFDKKSPPKDWTNPVSICPSFMDNQAWPLSPAITFAILFPCPCRLNAALSFPLSSFSRFNCLTNNWVSNCRIFKAVFIFRVFLFGWTSRFPSRFPLKTDAENGFKVRPVSSIFNCCKVILQLRWTKNQRVWIFPTQHTDLCHTVKRGSYELFYQWIWR